MYANETSSKKRIQELVPSLMELSFGCRVKDDRFGKGVGIVLRHYDGEDTYETAWANLTTELSPRNPFWEILGHPIQLHHVLMAINEQLFVDERGWMWRTDMVVKGTDVNFEDSPKVKWNLSAPLSDQEPEVFEFLAEVLNVNE